MLEKYIESRLTAGVKRMGGKAFKWVSPGNVGVPDRIITLPGGFIEFVELKAESGVLRPVQSIQIKFLQKMGFTVRVLYGIDDVEEYLKYLRGVLKNA